MIIVKNEDDEFFMINTKGVSTKIGEDFNNITISYDGSTIAYIDDDDVLTSYKVSNKSTKKIAEDVYCSAISPSGKSFAYVVDDDDDYKMYVYDGKKEYEFSKNSIPVGLTDDCKYIYYYDDYKEALYVTDLKDNSNKIASDVDDDEFIFNADHTQLMFCDDNGTYVTVKGKDKNKISSKNYATPLAYYVRPVVHSDYMVSAYTVDMKTFANQYYKAGDTIVYVNGKFEGEKVISNASSVEVSDNLKTIYYTNDSNTLYKCNLDGKYNATKIKADVVYFDITKDGSTVYFITDNDTLYFQKGKADSKKIGSDVGSVSVSHDGIAFFLTDYDSEDYTYTLYYSKGGKDKVKLSSSCMNVACYETYTFYYDNYEHDFDDDTWSYTYSYDVNYAASGTTFKKILSDGYLNGGF